MLWGKAMDISGFWMTLIPSGLFDSHHFCVDYLSTITDCYMVFFLGLKERFLKEMFFQEMIL